LLLSLDGALNPVPMAALVDKQDHLLIERFQITYFTYGRDLLQILAAGPTLSSSPVVIDAPDFGTRDPSAAQAIAPLTQRSVTSRCCRGGARDHVSAEGPQRSRADRDEGERGESKTTARPTYLHMATLVRN
jgi:hypothetical protein